MDEQRLLERIDRFVADNRAAIVDDMTRLIAQRSVREAPAGEKKPYGEGPAKALAVGLDIARGFGLETHDGEGQMGWAVLPGREAGHIATITHVDVVPEGDGWTSDPYTLVQRDGWLIGRGIADDKGPSILCLYLAKFYKELADESGAPLRYGLRVLLGTNEESGMGDVAWYLAHQPQPLFAFSPDADFPVCNGEKGHYLGTFLSGELADGNLLELNAGLAANVIPAAATCLVKGDAARLQSTGQVAVSAEAGAVRLTATGIGGHAAAPEGTQNAIGLLVDTLLENGLCTESENEFLRLLQKLHQSSYGEGVGIACSDEQFGRLTTNGGVIRLEDGRLSQSFDARYPTTITGTKIGEALTALAAAHGAAFTRQADDAPFYIEPDSPAIQALLNSSNQVLGRSDKPFTMGGGTYARHFKNAVSYGPGGEEIALPDFAGPEHAPNEGASLERMLAALKVYILALWRLQAVDF